jgi:PRTRC genetic system protein C
MALQVSKVKRKFFFEKEELQDIEELSLMQIKKHYCIKRPELTNSEIDGPEMKDGFAIYTFKSIAGDKG